MISLALPALQYDRNLVDGSTTFQLSTTYTNTHTLPIGVTVISMPTDDYLIYKRQRSYIQLSWALGFNTKQSWAGC